MPSFYQDRLGTNIGKALTKRRGFLRCNLLQAAIDSADAADANVVALAQADYDVGCGGCWHDGWIENATPFSKRYAICLYWAATTLSTVGYGDILPVTTEEMVFTVRIH